MISVRPREDRGRTRISWLDSQHSFSFGDYFDPQNLGFRSLRVINEDRVAPGAGFPTHGHRDMEILSYVLEGGLEHKDSSGGGGVIRPGEIQFMRAGRGVTHSEYNASKTEPVHFLQIWIVPDERGLEPAYGQHAFDAVQAASGWALLASRDGRDRSIRLHQDAELSVGRLRTGETRAYALAPGRHAWLQVARGDVRANGQVLRAGDGATLVGDISKGGVVGRTTDGSRLSDVSGEPSLVLTAHSDAEVLLFDLA